MDRTNKLTNRLSDRTRQAAARTAVVIPSLEPTAKLPGYVDALLASGFMRVVVVNDGSSAEYDGIFADLAARERCTVLRHEVNRGKGEALKTAYAWIETNAPDCDGVLTADSDGQHTVDDCCRLAAAMSEGEDGLYLGSRNFDLEHVPKKNRMGNKITSVVFRLLYGKYLPDTQTGLRAFRREELGFMRGVEGSRFEYEMNVLIECARRRLPMIPVEIETVYGEEGGASHFDKVRDSIRIYKVLLGRFFRFAGASIVCFLLDMLLAALIGDLLLPGLGMTDLAAIAWISGLGARVLSASCNFLINKNLVFGQKGGTAGAAWKYAALCIGIICLSNLGVTLLTFAHVARWLAKVICDLLLFFVSYRVQQIIFKK